MTHKEDRAARDAISTPLRREYQRLAASYDTHWQRYNNDVARRLRVHGLAPGARGLLDVGCGTGALLARFGNPGAVGVDPSKPMLRRMRTHPGVCARGEALPFANACFDTVMSTSALHYAHDPARVLAECRRVLPRGGRLLLVDWCADAWSTRLAVAGLRLMRRPLQRVLAVSDACALVTSVGFEVVATERFRAHPAWGMFLLHARAA